MLPPFQPLFHKIIVRDNYRSVWIPLPHPKTLIPLKEKFYKNWQSEERLKLQAAGETVVMPENINPLT